MSYRKVDYLIIGQGLAGSCLALQLIERGNSLQVIDQPRLNRSSAVAAGLFNPITGRVMTKTWKADLLFPYLLHFYVKAEQLLNAKFFYSQPLYRPFPSLSVGEQNEWMVLSEEPEMKKYVDRVFFESTFGHQVKDSLGGLLLKQCGYLDTLSFMEAVRTMLVSFDSYSEEQFNSDRMRISNDDVKYGNIQANKIVFCNGMTSACSKYFSQLPLRPLKGETLQIQVNELMQHIYNRGVYMVPSQHDHEYKVGATYNTQDKTEGITEAGRKELIEKLDDLINLPYKIAHQDWGIRPTTPDRRPAMGAHPNQKNVVIFNGLGTKGVSLAPYFSGQLADWLNGRGEIDKEVSIARFYSKM